MLHIVSHLHGLAFFIVTRKQQRPNFFQNLLKPNKIENAHFINKIIYLLKLLNFLFMHLTLKSTKYLASVKVQKGMKIIIYMMYNFYFLLQLWQITTLSKCSLHMLALQ